MKLISLNKIGFYVIFLISTLAFGQEIHFSQISNSPVFLNPGNTGNIDGDWRFSNNYRTQWSSIVPYTSLQIGFDKPFYLYTQRLSYGFNLIYDESGSLTMNQYSAYFSLAYHILLKSSYIHIGGQGGYVMKSIDVNNLVMPNQYDRTGGMYNPEYPSFETNIGDNFNYIDFNAGLIYEKMSGKFQPTFGYSLNHINRPVIGFVGDYNSYKIGFRHNVYMDLEFWMSDKLSFTPRYYRSEIEGVTDQLMGGDLLYKINEKGVLRNVFFGGYTRTSFNNTTDAVIVMAGFKVTNVRVEIDYDLNLSRLSEVTNYMGAFEVSLIYIAPSSVFEWFTIPCSRL